MTLYGTWYIWSQTYSAHSVHCNLEHFWKTVSDVVWLGSADLFAYVNPNHSLRTLEVAIFVKFIGYFFRVILVFSIYIVEMLLLKDL